MDTLPNRRMIEMEKQKTKYPKRTYDLVRKILCKNRFFGQGSNICNHRQTYFNECCDVFIRLDEIAGTVQTFQLTAVNQWDYLPARDVETWLKQAERFGHWENN